MTTQTQVIWTFQNAEIVRNVILAEIEILKNQGKTDGTYDIVLQPNPDYEAFDRPWTTLQDAENWLIFINSLEVPPVSAVILPEALPE